MSRSVSPLVVSLLLIAGPLAAQTTGTPVFLAPYRAFEKTEFGASLSDPGHGFALEGFYRMGQRRFDLGFRAGFADGDRTEAIFLAGIDFRTRIVDHSEDFPLDGAFTVGLGAQFGDGETLARIPFGISLGRRVQLEDSELEFVPYAHPVLIPLFGDNDPDGGDVDFALGLGVDIKLTRRFEIRVSGALGDLEGLSLSFAFLR